MDGMTIDTSPPLANSALNAAYSDRWLRIARVLAILFMAFCIVTFVWGLLLFPRYGLANLDAIRPNENWSDETLLAVMAAADVSVAGLGYAQLAVTLLTALIMVAVGLVIFWRKADSWFGLYVGVLFVWFGTQDSLPFGSC